MEHGDSRKGLTRKLLRNAAVWLCLLWFPLGTYFAWHSWHLTDAVAAGLAEGLPTAPTWLDRASLSGIAFVLSGLVSIPFALIFALLGRLIGPAK